jgi:hypothetical protein
VEVVSFTRFRVRAELPDEVLDARRAWAAECLGCEQFRGAILIVLEEGEWLDVSIWDQPPADGPTRPPEPPIDFIDRIDDPDTEILGQESGRLACGDLADESRPRISICNSSHPKERL